MIHIKTLIFILIIVLIVLQLLYYIIDPLKVKLLNYIVVRRGILAPDCKWWNISSVVLSDDSGIDLYNKYKQKYGDFAPTKMFGKKIYVVTNIKYIKTILDNSPDLFGVGIHKKKFFRSFMSKNVGVSQGCPWKHRRNLNEKVLSTDKMPLYTQKYNLDTIDVIQNVLMNKGKVTFNDMIEIGKQMCSRIVFSERRIPDQIFDIFTKANSVSYLTQEYINPTWIKKYENFLKTHINNPNPKSLVNLYAQHENNIDEIVHQIPHFMFPIVGLYGITIPRILLLLINHPSKLEKIKKEVQNGSNSYLRKCILETLRLNNPVVTTFRTLLRDFSFNEEHKFPKGTQFLILNNAILREKEFFDKPNQFIPERWTSEMEKSYYALSFNQGPQRCPGKEMAISLAESFIINFIKMYGILENRTKLETKKLDIENIPQMINPCQIKFEIKKIK